MLRKTLISLAVSSALFMSSAQALELGELTSQSRIDEPYRGRITVSDAAGLEANDINVRLGSESEFRQAGLTPTRTLSQLSFEVVKENGELAVLVQSDKPLDVDELNFVLAARWPSGQVVREYQTPINQSALVDKAQPEVVQSVTPEAQTTPANQIFRTETRQVQELTAKGEKRVERGNTLWSIAGKARPNNQLTIYQTMMAIQALNEDAFYANNINLLREGAVLRLPTEEQIKLFNRATSQQEFERQHAAWMALKQAGKIDDVVNQEQMNTQAASNTEPATQASTQDQLRLASNQSALPEAEASSNAADQQRISKLESELSATNELLDKETREKAELNNQLSELNQQLETLERLISLKDKQLAELERQFTSAQQAMQEQKNTVDQLLEADQLRREREAAEDASWKNKIFGNPIVLSVAGVVLLLLGLLIGMLIKRSGRKKDKPEDDKKEFDLAAAAPAAAAAAAAPEPAPTPSEPLTELDPEEEVIEEEDPFAFDFEVDETEEDSFEGFDDSVASSEVEPAQTDDAFGEFDIPELDEVAPEAPPEDVLGAEMDELSEDDNADPFAEFEVEDTDLEDDTLAEAGLEELDFSDPEPEADSMEMDDTGLSDENDLEDALADLGFGETEEPGPSPDAAVTEQPDYSEEEDFVNSLLTEDDASDASPDVDESAVFDNEPDAALAESIDEVLAEAQQEEEDFGGVEVPEFGPEEAAEDSDELDDDEENIDFFDASGDEVATKLDLARAYMDMGDEEGARVILDDVMSTGNESQITEAKSMMERMFPSE